MRLIRLPGSSSAFHAASRVAGSVSNSAAEGESVTGATTPRRTGSYCLVRCHPTKVCVISLVDDAVSRTWTATGMIPNARFSWNRPGGMVMLKGAEVPTSTARPTLAMPTSMPPGVVALLGPGLDGRPGHHGGGAEHDADVRVDQACVRATTEPVTVTVTPGPATQAG